MWPFLAIDLPGMSLPLKTTQTFRCCWRAATFIFYLPKIGGAQRSTLRSSFTIGGGAIFTITGIFEVFTILKNQIGEVKSFCNYVYQ